MVACVQTFLSSPSTAVSPSHAMYSAFDLRMARALSRPRQCFLWVRFPLTIENPIEIAQRPFWVKWGNEFDAITSPAQMTWTKRSSVVSRSTVNKGTGNGGLGHILDQRKS